MIYLKYWKYALGAILTLLLVISFVAYRKHVYNSGYETCTADIAAKTQLAKDQAQSNVAKVDKEHGVKIQYIQSQPDNGYIAGPITSSTIDRL